MIQRMNVVEKFLLACLEGLGARVDAIIAFVVSCQERRSVMIVGGAFFLKFDKKNYKNLTFLTSATFLAYAQLLLGINEIFLLCLD